jgi:hypothetical protein
MNAKTKIAHRVLNQRVLAADRQKKVHNFDTVKHVGLLWSFEQKEVFEQFRSFLRKKGIAVESLCYLLKLEQEQPDPVFFTKKDTTWLGFPKKEEVIRFSEKKFDMLIDLTIKKQFPLTVVCALSPAEFKVGYAGGEYNYYDVSIDVHEKPEPDYLMEQIVYYITRINKIQEE